MQVLTFVYAAQADTEVDGARFDSRIRRFPLTAAGAFQMRDTFERWGPWSYGHGAEVIILGATWQSIVRALAPPGNTLTDPRAPPPPVRLVWSDPHAASWSAVLAACAKAARCALRTPLETPRQPARQPYLDFVSHLRPIAAATGVALVDGFGATWDAVRAGAFAHHDATRIHFSDSGRRFLAQLALNALSQLLPIAAPLLPLGFLHYSLNR